MYYTYLVLLDSLQFRCKSWFQNEFEQETLIHFHDLKKDLREKGWRERESPEVSQTSFLRSENSDAELGFKFEWNWFMFTYTFTSTLHILGVRWLARGDLVKNWISKSFFQNWSSVFHGVQVLSTPTKINSKINFLTFHYKY